MSWMYLEGRTDYERRYRGEWEDNFQTLIPGRWEKGKFYSTGQNAGFPIEIWQLDQHMHFLNRDMSRKCFPGCSQCERLSKNEDEDAKRLKIIGEPFPKEVSGEYPCPDGVCKEAFSYKSQLLRHMEKEHKAVVEWDKICDLCCYQTMSTNRPEFAITKHKEKAHPEVKHGPKSQ